MLLTRYPQEQVSREWDTLSLRNLPRAAQNMFGGIDFKKGTECAGRFGIWTSVFLVAKVVGLNLFCLVHRIYLTVYRCNL